MRKWGVKGNGEGEDDEQRLDFTSAGGGSEGESMPGERKHLGKSGIDQEDAVRGSTHAHSLSQPPDIPLAWSSSCASSARSHNARSRLWIGFQR
jgi:hypothetical protein